jgi:tetratricopeptide (TPR) repeat protein
LYRYDEALASYSLALQICPDHAPAHHARALALQYLQRFDEALVGYQRAQQIKPSYAEAHFGEGVCRLLAGDFKEGWPKYEWRWRLKDFAAARPLFAQPAWLGREDVRGKTVLLHAEQGLGDTLHFCRYAPVLVEMGARVVLRVQAPLQTLLGSLKGVSQVVSEWEPLPEFDFHCPLLSLPLALNTAVLSDIPAPSSYLWADPEQIQYWQEKLGKAHKPKVGLVWSGNSKYKNDRHRSLPFNELKALFDLDLEFVSLQKEVKPSEMNALQASPVLQVAEELQDFSDTAALVSLLDRVITVDTSVAHLAGALGKPVWILLPYAPDFRWLVGRNDSPWYPTAQLFRQPAFGDWSSVIADLKNALLADF